MSSSSRDKLFVSNACTVGTFSLTNTTDVELRRLEASDAYQKWSQGKKKAILSGHQRAMRNNTQLLFGCFFAAVLLVMYGPVGQRHVWDVHGLLGMDTLNTFFRGGAPKVETSLGDRHFATISVPIPSALNNAMRSVCVVAKQLAAAAAKSSHVRAVRQMDLPPPPEPAPISEVLPALEPQPSLPPLSPPHLQQPFREKALLFVCAALDQLLSKLPFDDRTMSSPSSISVPIYVPGNQAIAFIGISTFLFGFILIMLPRLMLLGVVQRREREARDVVRAEGQTTDIAQHRAWQQEVDGESLPALLGPKAPLQLPTAKTAFVGASTFLRWPASLSLLVQSSSPRVGFTNEGELIAAYEQALLRAPSSSSSSIGLPPSSLVVTLRSSRLPSLLMWVGLCALEVAICYRRAEVSITTTSAHPLSIIAAFGMASLTEWLVLGLAVKATLLAKA